MSYFLCFDLEGPLSPQDSAYEMMKLFPGGAQVFEVISRYDDLLALEGKEGYEPGDTLALIVPFLLYHGIRENDIKRLALKAKLVEGAAELISRSGSRDWKIFCISTSYEQYALSITHRVGIPQERVACTSFLLDHYANLLCKDDLTIVAQVEENLSSLHPKEDDARIRQILDTFFWAELSSTRLGKMMKEVKPVGGRRKVEALQDFATTHNQPLGNFIVVGDSITDAEMLKVVDRAGGVAIAFNANEYALAHATASLASTNLGDLAIVLDAWERGGREAVEAEVRAREKSGDRDNREHFHWLAGIQDIQLPLEIHRRIRRLVREEAARLG